MMNAKGCSALNCCDGGGKHFLTIWTPRNIFSSRQLLVFRSNWQTKQKCYIKIQFCLCFFISFLIDPQIQFDPIVSMKT